MRGFSQDRDQQALQELTQFARQGSAEDRDIRKTDAELDWQSARAYPLIALCVLTALSMSVGGLCLGGGSATYAVLAVFAVGLMFAVFAMKRWHRNAYIALHVANGMSEADALKNYHATYSSD
jgi:hypothetical protein